MENEVGERDEGSLEAVNGRLSELDQQQREVVVQLDDAQGQFMACKDELVSLRNEKNTLAARLIEMKTKQQAVEKKREEVKRTEEECQKERACRDECSQRVTPAKEAVREEQAKKDAAVTKRLQLNGTERVK
ncbi:hypothetical protein FHG87_025702, partial [Trinorchestia longiramus]